MRAWTRLGLVATLGCSMPVRTPVVEPALDTGSRAMATVETAPVQWKERMPQAYVYVEHVGDYRALGEAFAPLANADAAGEVLASGSPFVLLYDDPARIPIDSLRARVCLPVDVRPSDLPAGVAFDVLPSALVVYARVDRDATRTMRSVPRLLDSMQRLGGRPSGPIREILLPSVGDDTPRTEIQIPWIIPG